MNLISRINFFYTLIKKAFTEINALDFIKTLIFNYDCFIQLDQSNFRLATKVFSRDSNNVLHEVKMTESYNKNLEYLYKQYNSSFFNIEGSHITNIVRISPFTGKLLKNVIPKHHTIKQGTSTGILEIFEINIKHFWNTVESRSNENVFKNKSEKGEYKDLESLSKEELEEIEFSRLLAEEAEEKREKEEKIRKEKKEKERLDSLGFGMLFVETLNQQEFITLFTKFLKEKMKMELAGPYRITRVLEKKYPSASKMLVLKYEKRDIHVPLDFNLEINSIETKKKLISLIENTLKENFSSMKDSLEEKFVSFLKENNILP